MRGHIRRGKAPRSWYIVLELGRDPATGKRRQKWFTVHGTKREAELRKAKLIAEHDHRTLVLPSKVTLGAFLERWLREYVDVQVRATTATGYRAIVIGHLIPSLGRIPLDRLEPRHLQEYYARLMAGGRRDGRVGGLSARTLHHHRAVLSEALNHAMRWGLIGRNVAQLADAPRVRKAPDIQTLNMDEARRLLAEAREESEYHHVLVHLPLYTGFRRSEVLGLRRRAVNLEWGTLSVAECLHKLSDGRLVLEEPKSRSSRRLVTIAAGTVDILQGHMQRQEEERAATGLRTTDDTLLFARGDDSIILPNGYTRAFKRIAKKAGVPGASLHNLRHTHASLLLQIGVHFKVVSERLGHASIAITLDLYSHLVPGLQEGAAARFEEHLADDAVSRLESELGA